jgi:hypothetical protein
MLFLKLGAELLPQVRKPFLIDMRWHTLKRPAAVKQTIVRQSRHAQRRQNLQEVLDFLKVSQGREPSKHSADEQERSVFYKLRQLKKCPDLAVEYERTRAAHQRSESMPAGSQAFVTPVKRSHLHCDSVAGSGSTQRLRKSEYDDTPAQSHRLSEAAAEKLAQSFRKSPAFRTGCPEESRQGDLPSPCVLSYASNYVGSSSISPVARRVSLEQYPGEKDLLSRVRSSVRELYEGLREELSESGNEGLQLPRRHDM